METRQIPSLVPESAQNATAQAIVPILENQIERVRSMIAMGATEVTSDGTYPRSLFRS